MTDLKPKTMKAIQGEGIPYSVSINSVPLPTITDPLDIIIRITSSSICGTDLHTYHGRVPTAKNQIFGHENIGIVSEIGADITTLSIGDRVIISSTIYEGTNNADTEQIGVYGAGNYGAAGIIPGLISPPGGQAQYLRVPFANVNALKLPPGKEHELEY
jgi:threonine dehydrogenase-like Zn-dependent dehydrogenase